jgi:uncharacterized membrane protein
VLEFCVDKRDNENAIFDGSKEVNMVVQRSALMRGELPKSLISLVLGILASISGLLALSSVFINLVAKSGVTVQEFESRFFGVLVGMIAAFLLGVASGVVGSEALPAKNSRPHWKMCRICAGSGIAFGILAMLSYLAFIALLPVIFPLPQ